MEIVFAAISPHPPILLPSVGSEKDRKKLKKTLSALEILSKKFKQVRPDKIIISSPHLDWGFEVPLYFLAKNFNGKIEKILIGSESPKFYFETGKNFYKKIKIKKSKIALIASGDLSHCLLKEVGPYGFHPDGPKFDKNLIKYLKERKVKSILRLDEKFPEAGECGLRSFCFLLGMIEAQSEALEQNWKIKILSYEYPFGVGYLVTDFLLT